MKVYKMTNNTNWREWNEKREDEIKWKPRVAENAEEEDVSRIWLMAARASSLTILLFDSGIHLADKYHIGYDEEFKV